MTYIVNRQGKGDSTQLISARIQISHLEFAEENGFVFNKLVNKALETFEHDLQTDHEVERASVKLTWSCSVYTAYDEDGRGSRPKMLRVQTHLLDYLKMNEYKVNAAINLALERWIKYYKTNRVADYVINNLQRRGKY